MPGEEIGVCLEFESSTSTRIIRPGGRNSCHTSTCACAHMSSTLMLVHSVLGHGNGSLRGLIKASVLRSQLRQWSCPTEALQRHVSNPSSTKSIAILRATLSCLHDGSRQLQITVALLWCDLKLQHTTAGAQTKTRLTKSGLLIDLPPFLSFPRPFVFPSERKLLFSSI